MNAVIPLDNALLVDMGMLARQENTVSSVTLITKKSIRFYIPLMKHEEKTL